MVLTQSDLNIYIDQKIKANGIGQITGPWMQDVLLNMSNTLVGSHFLYPHTQLTDADVGKIVMNDGTGNAVVYQLSKQQDESLGRYQVHLDSVSSFTESSSIVIKNLKGNYTVTHDMIVDSTGKAPTTIDGLFNNMKAAFARIGLTGYNFSNDDANNNLLIGEQKYNSTKIKLNNVNSSTDFTTIDKSPSGIINLAESRPSLPDAPTKYPLGRLKGIDGGTALVSSAVIETYELAAPFTLLNSLFDYDANVPITVGNIESTVRCIIQPWSNGQAMPLDITQFNFNNGFVDEVRQQFIGLAIGATSTTVTVYNIPYLSFLLSIVLRLAESGVL